MTRRNDVQNDLQDGFEPSPLPPISPDGAPKLSSLRVIADPPPRLCEAGPCRHYHRFGIQLDVQSPIGVRVMDGDKHGQIIGQAAQEFRVQTHHFCYPETGVETNLGELPVTHCSRWDPLLPKDLEEVEGRRSTYWATLAGKDWATQLGNWRRNREAEQADAAGIEAMIAEAEGARETTKEKP